MLLKGSFLSSFQPSSKWDVAVAVSLRLKEECEKEGWEEMVQIEILPRIGFLGSLTSFQRQNPKWEAPFLPIFTTLFTLL